MEPVRYYFDESGEKGFLTSSFSASDIGLIAGIALPARVALALEAETDSILARLDTTGIDKLHATELFKDGKNLEVRDSLLEFLRNRNEWLLVYEAIYPLGLYKSNESIQQLLAKTKPNNTSVKVAKNERCLRIYTELLKGVVIKLDAVCQTEESSDLLMISDRLDEGIHREALQLLDHLKQKVHVKKISGFDTVTKKVVHSTLKSSIQGFDATVRYVTDIRTETAPSNLTIVADIVTNTLYRHLKSVVKENPNIRLHSNAAVKGFQLLNRIAFVSDSYIADSMYSPKDL
jgi:hypothetical protein